MRGQVTAFYLFMFIFFGAMGSWFIGAISDHVTGDLGNAILFTGLHPAAARRLPDVPRDPALPRRSRTPGGYRTMTAYPSLHMIIDGERVSGGAAAPTPWSIPPPARRSANCRWPIPPISTARWKSAAKGFRIWRDAPAQQRAAVLQGAARLMLERQEEIARDRHHGTGQAARRNPDRSADERRPVQFLCRRDASGSMAAQLVRPAGHALDRDL